MVFWLMAIECGVGGGVFCGVVLRGKWGNEGVGTCGDNFVIRLFEIVNHFTLK